MLNQAVDNFSFEATSGLKATLSDFRGKWLVFYFYPRDATPGCTVEGQDFSNYYHAFKRLNAEIFGISRDSLASHEKFKTKQEFPFELISDPREELCQLFEVMRNKNMYGKQVRGIERSTFIIDPDGLLCKEWRKVKVPEHVKNVLDYLKEKQNGQG